MRRVFANTRWTFFVICALFLALSVATSGIARAQEESGKTKMGPYLTLAKLIHEEVQKGDYPKAVELAHVLEDTWDQGPGGGGNQSLVKTNGTVFQETDHAMDEFVLPIMNYSKKTPDTTSVEAAYKAFVDKLKDADAAPVIPAPKVLHLSAEALKAFEGKYQQEDSKHPHPPVAIIANENGLLLDRGDENIRLLPFGPLEFFVEQEPVLHFSFSKENGKITGVMVTGSHLPRKFVKLP